MTVSIFEHASVNEATGDMIYPPQRRRANVALSTFWPLSDTAAIRGVCVYNNSNSTGVHLRVTTDQSVGSQGDQGDVYVGPDAVATFLIPRKLRVSADDQLFLYAVADT